MSEKPQLDVEMMPILVESITIQFRWSLCHAAKRGIA